MGATDIFNRQYHITRNFLGRNENFIVTRSDKVNSTVVMLNDDYYSKITQLVEDEDLHGKLDKDLTTYYENRINKIVRGMYDN